MILIRSIIKLNLRGYQNTIKIMANLTSEDVADLLLRVDDETEDAKEELEHAQSIIQSTGLTVHSSVINNFAGGDATAISSTNTTSDDQQQTATATNNTPAMDLQQEAALAVQARHKYNPMRGTLSAFPLVLTTTGGHQNTGKSVFVLFCRMCVFSLKSR